MHASPVTHQLCIRQSDEEQWSLWLIDSWAGILIGLAIPVTFDVLLISNHPSSLVIKKTDGLMDMGVGVGVGVGGANDELLIYTWRHMVSSGEVQWNDIKPCKQ